MSNYNQSLIEDYRQTIERLQKECTEKTNAIIALGEQLKAEEQECEKYEQLFDELDKRVSNCIKIYDCIIVSKIVKDIISKAKGEIMEIT